MFTDDWIDKEENMSLADTIFYWLLRLEPDVVIREERHLDLGEETVVPSLEALADRLKPCLQETEEIPKDFTQLFSDNLFR